LLLSHNLSPKHLFPTDDIDSIVEELKKSKVSKSTAEDDDEEEEETATRRRRAATAAPTSFSSDSYSDLDTASSSQMAAAAMVPKLPPRTHILNQLLDSAGITPTAIAQGTINDDNLTVTGIITCNSNYANPGSIYVCVPAQGFGADDEDGHDWASDACELGISAIVAERPITKGTIPPHIPVIMVDNTLDALGKIAAAYYDFPSTKVDTVGIVGSYGKTTTAWLSRGVFEEADGVIGMVGSIEYAMDLNKLTREGDFWVPEEEDPTAEEKRDCSAPFHLAPYLGKYGTDIPTTPDALALQALIAGMVDRGATKVIIEIDSDTLADGRLDAVEFNALVLTNFHEDEENAEEMSEQIVKLFETKLRNKEVHSAVVNARNELGRNLMQLLDAREIPVLPCALEESDIAEYMQQQGVPNVITPASVGFYVEKIKESIWDTEVVVSTPVGKLQIISNLIGRQFVENIIMAVGVGVTFGIPLEDIVPGIEAVDPIPGRCEIIDDFQDFSVIVDSAKTPEQLGRFLDEIRDAGARRILLVVGAKGATTTAEDRSRLGQVADKYADVVFFTNDSPGTFFPHEIISDIVKGIPHEKIDQAPEMSEEWMQDPHRLHDLFLEKLLLQYQSIIERYVVEDRYSAIRLAIGMAKPKDVVVVAGRGHEDYIEVWDGMYGQQPYTTDFSHETMGTIKGWFDDRVECRNALSKLSYLNSIKDLDRKFLPWTRYPDDDREVMSQFKGVKAVDQEKKMKVKEMVERASQTYDTLRMHMMEAKGDVREMRKLRDEMMQLPREQVDPVLRAEMEVFSEVWDDWDVDSTEGGGGGGSELDEFTLKEGESDEDVYDDDEGLDQMEGRGELDVLLAQLGAAMGEEEQEEGAAASGATGATVKTGRKSASRTASMDEDDAVDEMIEETKTSTATKKKSSSSRKKKGEDEDLDFSFSSADIDNIMSMFGSMNDDKEEESSNDLFDLEISDELGDLEDIVEVVEEEEEEEEEEAVASFEEE